MDGGDCGCDCGCGCGWCGGYKPYSVYLGSVWYMGI